MRLHLFACCFFLLPFCRWQKAAAQYAEKDFTRYSVKDGLSDNRINCLAQDDHGYIWIGTETGLNRFDGTSFKKFYQADPPLALPSGFITRLKRYGPHQLGICTRGGFEVLDTKTYAVQRYIIPDSTAFTTPLNAVWDAAQLKDGSFALTSAAGFYVVGQNGRVALRHDAYTADDIGRKRILYGRDIFTAGNDQYIVYVQESGQAIYDDKKKTFRELSDTEPEWRHYLNPKRLPDGPGWLIKRQLNKTESFFISYHSDSIFYYNRAWNKTVASLLPFSVAKELDWASRIEPLNDSVFLISTSNTGFFRLTLDKKTGVISGNGEKYFSNYEIISLLMDKDSRLWVGTTKGLLKQELTPPFINAYQYKPANSTANKGAFTCLYRYKNILYAGRYARNGGLSLLDASTMQMKKEVRFYGPESPCNELLTIQMYHPDTLWLGTWGGILWYDTKSGHYGKVLDEKTQPWAADFHAVLAPPRSDGYAWMCSYLVGKVARYHIASKTFTFFTSQTTPALPFDKVKNIAYDSYGDVWIGGHALTRWNNRLQNFDTLIKVYGGPNKFNDDILSFTGDDKGSLWLHNADNGLLEYRIREKIFIAYGIKDGLPSNALRSLSRVIDGKLWVAGNSQICLLDTRTKKFTLYDQADGLSEYIPSSRRMYYDSTDKQFYLCCEDYIIRFPKTPEKHPDHSSELLLEELSVNNERSLYAPADAIEVAYNEANLRFDFTVVDYEKNNYQFTYRLNNGSWSPIGPQHNISFNNLSPDNYSIEIKALGKQGIEKQKKLSLIVHPPFWLRAWFLAIVSALFIGVIYLLFRARVRRVRQRANLDKLLSQTEMKALQAQMNPHFIFNSLNSIREMILNNENKDASHYLSKFAHLIRMTLDQSAQARVSLRQTVDYLNRYMEMETIRNALFTYEVAVDEHLEVDETYVSPMLIQPFIENAIWHGVSAARKNIHVRVAFVKKEETLVCTIDDDGIGIYRSQAAKQVNGSSRRHHSHGIANIKNRITLLNEKYNLDCNVSIADKQETLGKEETGTLVRLQLPLQTSES